LKTTYNNLREAAFTILAEGIVNLSFEETIKDGVITDHEGMKTNYSNHEGKNTINVDNYFNLKNFGEQSIRN
jgi:hypothetical protein